MRSPKEKNEKRMPLECEIIYIVKIMQLVEKKYPNINNLNSSGWTNHIKRKMAGSSKKMACLQYFTVFYVF